MCTSELLMGQCCRRKPTINLSMSFKRKLMKQNPAWLFRATGIISILNRVSYVHFFINLPHRLIRKQVFQEKNLERSRPTMTPRLILRKMPENMKERMLPI